MGKIAAELADFVIVTSDNPRTEQPQAIIDDILAGMQDSDTPRHVEPDRVEAIHYAMDNAGRATSSSSPARATRTIRRSITSTIRWMNGSLWRII